MKKSGGGLFNVDFSSMSFAVGNDPGEVAEKLPKLNHRPVRYENAMDLAKSMEYGQNYVVMLAGDFIYGDFIEALLYEKQLFPSKMYIATLGMSRENIDSLYNCVEYLKCKELNLILSHYFVSVERRGMVPYIEEQFTKKNINIAMLRSHAKICLIRSDKGDCVIMGSANLSSSNNMEQMTITHDKTMIDYLENGLQNVMNKFAIFRGLDPRMQHINNFKGHKAKASVIKHPEELFDIQEDGID